MSEPFDGRPYVADTTAWEHRNHPQVSDEWRAALLAGQLYITPVVKLELLYSTRSPEDFSWWEERLDQLPEAPLDRATAGWAVGAMRDLARSGPLHHRVPVQDVMIAAAAAQRGVGVLHRDRRFDRLAGVLGFESRWLVPRDPD